MPTKANKSQSSPLKEATKACTSKNSVIQSVRPESVEEDCSCSCENHRDSEEEWVVDKEELLHVEINGIFQDILPTLESNSVPRDKTNEIVRFVGLDSSEPIAQIGGLTDGVEEATAATFFSGHYENTIGTSTFFALQESDLETNGINDDSVFGEISEASAAKRVRYTCKADKKLVLKRVFLNQKAKHLVAKGTKEEEGLERAQLPSSTAQHQSKYNKIPGPSRAASDV